MKIRSITRYLLLYASVLAIIVAFVSGIVLTEFFRRSAEQSFDEQLDIVLKIIVGDLAQQMAEGAELKPPQNLGEPRFELPLSGWYWTISNSDNGRIILSSASLVGGDFNIFGDDGGGEAVNQGRKFYGFGPEGKRLRILERSISFSSQQRLMLRISGDAEELYDRVDDFQRKAWLTMAAFGAILLVVTILLVRAASRPLNRLQYQVREVTEGRATAIEGDFPIEISGLVNEANILIESNKETLERARTQVGNLAHALKTPLSVIMNETRDMSAEKGGLLRAQTTIMRDQIQLYLERARIAARRNVVGSVTDVAPLIVKLVDVMGKIHREKSVSLVTDESRGMRFRGEVQDLEEMVGNLVDNACKWADSTVSVSIVAGDAVDVLDDLNEVARADNWMSILVEDDGPGMSEQEMKLAVKRGHRIDENLPGSGLGLSIVEEIASLYKGRFELTTSTAGGVKAILVLPIIGDGN